MTVFDVLFYLFLVSGCVAWANGIRLWLKEQKWLKEQWRR